MSYSRETEEWLRNIQRRNEEELNRYRERDQRRAANFDFLLAGRGRSSSPAYTSSIFTSEDEVPINFRRSGPPPQQARPYPSGIPRAEPLFPQDANRGRTFYNPDDADLPEEFRRRQSPPQSRRRPPSPEARSWFRPDSPPYSPPPRRATSPPRRAHTDFPRRARPPPQRAYSPPRPRSPPLRRASPPPFRPRTPPFNQAPPRTHTRDANPRGIYTYSDEEPDTIPIAPAAWNNYSSTITREQLVEVLKRTGCSEEVARAEADKKFAAHAPSHKEGEGAGRSGPSWAEMEREREGRGW